MGKILVLGYFGYVTGKLDGQTVKTRAVRALLDKYLKEDNPHIVFFDTEVLKSGKMRILHLLFQLMGCRKVVYLPGQNNLKGFFPILFRLSRIFRFDILYVMIGGWLPDFLRKNPGLIGRLASVKAVFPENAEVKRRLEAEYGFGNVVLMPNFRFSFPCRAGNNPAGNEGKVFRLVFMSRVTEKKGIFTVFSVLDRLRERGVPVRADFYGQLDGRISEAFDKALGKCPEAAYRGCLAADEVVSVLSGYDMMILPTFYEGEGFPGAVVESYMAGIPVAISDWKYNSEYVRDGQTGFLVALDGNQAGRYADLVEDLARNPQRLSRLKENASEEGKKYSDAAAWKILAPYVQAGKREIR